MIPSISLKPFLPTIVGLLQDSQESVRNASKNAIISLYNSTKSPVLKSNVFSEMEKQSTRAAIVSFIKGELDRDQASSLSLDVPSPELKSIPLGQSTTSKGSSSPSSNRPRSSTPSGALPMVEGQNTGSSAPEPTLIQVSTQKSIHNL